MDIKGFFEEHKKGIGIGVLVSLMLIYLTSGAIATRKAQKEQEEAERLAQEAIEQQANGEQTEDSILMQMQPDLVKSYGKVPDGFIWQTDGTILSLGDKSMSAEDVVYAYFRGLTS